MQLNKINVIIVAAVALISELFDLLNIQNNNYPVWDPYFYDNDSDLIGNYQSKLED